MTLIERVQRLRRAAVAAEDEDRIKYRTGQLMGQADSVETTLDTVRRVGDGVAELRTAGVALPSELLAQATQVSRTLDALSKMLPEQDTAASLDKPKADIKSAQSYVKSLRRAVEEAWATKRDHTPPVINEDLVDTLGRSGIDVEEIRTKIEKARGQLNILLDRPVPQRGDVARLAAALESLSNCGREITELVDPILTGVIMDAQDLAGAPLNAFTPEVLIGLAKLGILDRFRVRLR